MAYTAHGVSLHAETDSTTLVKWRVAECSERTHNCHESAICSDVVGGFNCICDTGFIENGTFC